MFASVLAALWAALVLWLGAALGLLDPEDRAARARLRDRVRAAGFAHPYALEAFSVVRVVLAIALPIVLVPLVGIASLERTFAAGVVIAAAGFYAPEAWLRWLRGAR